MTPAGSARYNVTMRVMILAALLPEARAIARAFHLSSRFAKQFVTGDAVTVGLVGPGARGLEGVHEGWAGGDEG